MPITYLNKNINDRFNEVIIKIESFVETKPFPNLRKILCVVDILFFIIMPFYKEIKSGVCKKTFCVLDPYKLYCC